MPSRSDHAPKPPFTVSSLTQRSPVRQLCSSTKHASRSSGGTDMDSYRLFGTARAGQDTSTP